MCPRIPVTILVRAHGTSNPDAQSVCGGGVLKIYLGYGQDGCPGENFDYHSIATPQKNNICPYIQTKCSVLPSGGCSLKSGVRICEALKTLFPRPCGFSQDSISIFHFSRPYFPPPSQFRESLFSKALKLAKSSVPKPHVLKISLHDFILLRNLVN